MVGDGHPVRVMAVINVSSESFYKDSVRERIEDVVEAAERLKASALIVHSMTGALPQLLAASRPQAPVLVGAPTWQLARRLTLY
ncbi:MAG: pyruvate kinase alpha/beta domain-containing protein [Pyrodictiaceae archaeon]